MRAAARSSQVFSSSLKRALSRFSWARPQAASPYPNFVEEPADASAFFDPATWARLRTVKAAYDPANVFVGNHHIPPV
jgi:FAD/FMN-containing dehydrogenase